MTTPASDNGPCGACGRKGRRHCPALDKPICTACCGDKRGSTLACPSDCPHFPFGTAGFDLWRKLDEQWLPKAARRIVESLGDDLLRATARRMATGRPGDDAAEWHGLACAIHYLLGIHRDAQGRTVAERWEAEKFRGLNNDERVMTKLRAATRPAVFEVYRIAPPDTVEGVDLLDPARGRFTLIDRPTAAAAVRFARYLVWITHYPHFSRPVGTAVEIPDNIHAEFMQDLTQRAGKDAPPDALRLRLAEQFGELPRALNALLQQKRERLLAHLTLAQCRAFYRLAGPAGEVRAILDGHPEFRLDASLAGPDDPPNARHYLWLRREETGGIKRFLPALLRGRDAEAAPGLLATVRVAGDEFMLQTFAPPKMAAARALAESLFGARLAFDREEAHDLVRESLAGDAAKEAVPRGLPAAAPAAAGASPAEEEAAMQTFYRDFYTRFLDNPVPALADKSPREAAHSRRLRPALVDLMKQHICTMDRMCRDRKMNIDIAWAIQELGLTELL